LVAGSNPARGAKQAPEKSSLFRSLLFLSSGKNSDLASTLQADFPHLSVQSCKVSCKVFPGVEVAALPELDHSLSPEGTCLK
jgi:hypothetical protein